MKPEIYLEALHQAKERGMRTSGHLPGPMPLARAFDAGLGTVEHLSQLLRAATPREAELAAQVADGKLTGREVNRLSIEGFDEATARVAFRHMAARGTAVMPTLSVSRITAYLDQEDHSRDSYLRSLHDEITLYVKHGLSTRQALQSAVVNGPRFLGKLDRYGSVAAGKAADLLVLDADPLADIGATRKIRMEVSRGEVHDRVRLDAMLDGVRRWVASQP